LKDVTTSDEGGAAFTDFVAERQRALLRFAMVLSGDAALSEDLVGEVLARAYQQWHRIGAVADTNAYVRRMIVNEYTSWWRHRRRTLPHAHLDDYDPPTPDHAAHHAKHEAMVRRLARLPRRQRAAVVLRYYEGMSDDDIAAILGCSTGTVRSHISRGIATLRIELAAEGHAANPAVSALAEEN
jgi:RNA polymerase sigma-70 factor (sigma-E family)